MSEKCYGITNGKYTLQEGDGDNQFYFYRNDGIEIKEDVGRIPLDLYQAFITNKMFKGEIPPETVAKNVYYNKRSEDGKVILVEVYDPGTEPWKSDKKKQESSKTQTNHDKQNEPNFWQCIVKKIFG